MGLKKINIEQYKTIIEKVVLNKKIKEEILTKFDYFDNSGEIRIIGNVLYAKNRNDFLELRYENNCLLCTYSEWSFAKVITISVKELKNKNKKLERKEKIEYEINDNKSNATKIEEIEEIYNAEDKLAYESKSSSDLKYYTFDNRIQYLDNHYFTNYYELNKKWYIHNGSIIQYKLSKSFMSGHSILDERYSICQSPVYDVYASYYDFVELDEELFKEFMSGKINIDDLLKQLEEKKLKKTLINDKK